MATIQQQLFDLQDKGYRDFQIKLTPGIDPESVIGVRTPQLRALAKQIAKSEERDAFLDALPHPYYDENNLHGFVLSELKDYDETIARLDAFLPYVDNWATCDLLSPKAFKQKKNHERLLLDIQRWMASDRPYTIRFGIEMLMSFFLDDEFRPEYLEWVALISQKELQPELHELYSHYYIRMMIAWYFATALAKQYEATVPFIEQNKLATWTHNKSIQKAIESYRITDGQKAYLRSLKRK